MEDASSQLRRGSCEATSRRLPGVPSAVSSPQRVPLVHSGAPAFPPGGGGSAVSARGSLEAGVAGSQLEPGSETLASLRILPFAHAQFARLRRRRRARGTASVCVLAGCAGTQPVPEQSQEGAPFPAPPARPPQSCFLPVHRPLWEPGRGPVVGTGRGGRVPRAASAHCPRVLACRRAPPRVRCMGDGPCMSIRSSTLGITEDAAVRHLSASCVWVRWGAWHSPRPLTAERGVTRVGLSPKAGDSAPSRRRADL